MVLCCCSKGVGWPPELLSIDVVLVSKYLIRFLILNRIAEIPGSDARRSRTEEGIEDGSAPSSGSVSESRQARIRWVLAHGSKICGLSF